MLKRLVLMVAFVLLFTGIVNAEMIENYYATSNTVSFSTTTIVTFNTIINSLFLRNESTTDSLFVFYKKSDIGWNDNYTVYTIPVISYTLTGIVVPSGNCARLSPSSTSRWSEITLNAKTDTICVVQPRSPSANIGITYVAETDRKQP